jgi:hypothetical protein
MKIIGLFFLIIVTQLTNALANVNPYLCFTDLTSGPSTGNGDTSQPGQVANKDGAIVTLWGKHLGSSQGRSQVIISGMEARVYRWGDAKAPADLSTHQGMQMIEFQIPGSLKSGITEIRVIVNGQISNPLPFTIRDGKIYYVMKNGNDETGDGSWTKPWAHLDNLNYTGALDKIKPGDIVYMGDGVTDTTLAGDRACVDIGNPGTIDAPKAIVAYPGAVAGVGNVNSQRTFSLWVSGFGPSVHWVISKLHLIAREEAVSMYHGFRVVGNKIMAPKGDGPTGAISGLGNHLYILGNELTNIGFKGTSKLYHPIYIQSQESCSGPRLPSETDREIAWNDMHDNLAFDGINLYRECGSSAYMSNHRVHDNFILNQTGCGIRIGDYVVGENWFYNNIVVNAGAGPDPTTEQAMHVPVYIHAGWDDTTTLIHFYNNTIYGGGFTGGADWSTSMVGFAYNHPMSLDFRNNIIVSTDTDIDYLNSRLDIPRQGVDNNLWYGESTPPAWDRHAMSNNPMFENALQYDFHLKDNSPAIDQGKPVLYENKYPLPTIDFDGNERLKGMSIDLGALENQRINSVATGDIQSLQIKVFPNPANHSIHLEIPNRASGSEYINVYDALGRLQSLFKTSYLNESGQNLDVSFLSSGIYFIKAGVATQKVVIER